MTAEQTAAAIAFNRAVYAYNGTIEMADDAFVRYEAATADGDQEAAQAAYAEWLALAQQARPLQAEVKALRAAYDALA